MIDIIQWIVFYIGITVAMCLDNCFWISASPEYNDFKDLGWFKPNNEILEHEGKQYETKIDYILKYRVWSVITDFRDIIPAVISSGLLMVIL